MSEPIAVWAPSAASVALQLRDGSMAMVPDAASGWWHGPTLAPDTDYRFVVDGTALSDPRSPRLPEGPEGWSRTVDHTAFSWTDDAWTGRDIAGGVVYELHVGTFSQAGTFAAAIEHLDHLVALGVAAVEIMPVATFPGRRGWGYDGVGLFAPLEHYGGPAG
ncbi:MAG TPA: hypothetical protein PLV68_02285, partial [Ilumatobacteraceae bacterium]|nr:hypothetical protein [Ilumatobacteraceae bacterium]